MPRYFFHVHHDKESIDRDSLELPTNDVAKTMAVRWAGELLKDLGGSFWSAPDWRAWVTDENSATICTFRFIAEEEAQLHLIG
jgi:hypothetical protein